MTQKKITPTNIKKDNRKKIYNVIYTNVTIAKQEIADLTKISLPTIASNLDDFEKEGLISRKASFASTGGRKAKMISCIQDAKVAIGVEIAKEFFTIAIIDLYANPIAKKKYQKSFATNDTYYRFVTSCIQEIVKQTTLDTSTILGVSIAIQGLVTSDGKQVSYGKILDCTGLQITVFQQYLDYPCRFIHDATAACIAELWFNPNIKNAVYLSLSKNLGGSIIIDGKVHTGSKISSGLLEHMTLIPNGNTCYCGKNGCLEAYCGVNVLLQKHDNIKAFFQNLRNDGKDEHATWLTYLQHLAQGLHNIFMVLGSEMILGGQLSEYLIEEDMILLRQILQDISAFSEDEQSIRIATCTTESIVTGAALPLIEQFIKAI